MSSTVNVSAIIKKDKPNEPEYKKLDNNIKFSFTVSYILLLTTATITFIEALRTQTPYVRHILNLETAISVVAGYFYSIFVDKIAKSEEKMVNMDWAEITQTRYVDWAITTPMMLLALCLVLSSNSGKVIRLFTFLTILGLNYIMLYLGYLGEMKQMSRLTANSTGFIAFFAMFYVIFTQYVLPKFSKDNYFLYFAYLGIWTMYGVVYMFNEEYKNIAMNYLDLTAKCLIGLGLWVYYTKIVQY
jgi:bacteriorhodopsin